MREARTGFKTGGARRLLERGLVGGLLSRFATMASRSRQKKPLCGRAGLVESPGHLQYTRNWSDNPLQVWVLAGNPAACLRKIQVAAETSPANGNGGVVCAFGSFFAGQSGAWWWRRVG